MSKFGGVTGFSTGTIISNSTTITYYQENIYSETVAYTISDMYEISGPIKQGDSGGPVFTSDQYLVGIISATSSTSTYATKVSNIQSNLNVVFY